MKPLTHEQEMKLSELLFKALDMGCWHEWAKSRFIYWCQQCQKDGGDVEYHGVLYLAKHCKCRRKYQYSSTSNDCVECGKMYFKNEGNPSLFSRSAFLDVFDAVKDREDFQETWGHWHNLDAVDENLVFVSININSIVSPDFQYDILHWLLKKDGRLGEFEEVMKEEGG